MKKTVLSWATSLLLISHVQGQEEVPLGSVVPERITFTQVDADLENSTVTNPRLTDFRSFEGQVLVVIYYASW